MARAPLHSHPAFCGLRHFLREVWRMRWMIVLPALVITLRARGILADSSALTLICYKPALACIGFVAGHIAWSQALCYIERRDLVREDRSRMVMAVLRGFQCGVHPGRHAGPLESSGRLRIRAARR
jgi:hypothetical protein